MVTDDPPSTTRANLLGENVRVYPERSMVRIFLSSMRIADELPVAFFSRVMVVGMPDGTESIASSSVEYCALPSISKKAFS